MIIRADEMTDVCAQNVYGGSGDIYSADIWPKDKFPIQHGKFMRLVRIPPGSKLGFHMHSRESELFYAIYGSIKVMDDQECTRLERGDALLTGDGHSHSLFNDTDGDFVMVSILLYD